MTQQAFLISIHFFHYVPLNLCSRVFWTIILIVRFRQRFANPNNFVRFLMEHALHSLHIKQLSLETGFLIDCCCFAKRLESVLVPLFKSHYCQAQDSYRL